MRRWLMCLFLVVSVLGCSPNESDSAAPRASGEAAPASTQPRQNESEPEPASITLNRTRGEREQAASRPVEGQRLPVTRNDTLLGVLSRVPVMPADFELGPLYADTGSGDMQAVVRVGAAFFQSLAEGTLNARVIVPDAAIVLARSLRPYLEGDVRIEAVRFGMPVIDDSLTGQVRTRIFGDVGETTGILILEYVEGAWMVVDLQADLLELRTPKRPREEPFRPYVERQRG